MGRPECMPCECVLGARPALPIAVGLLVVGAISLLAATGLQEAPKPPHLVRVVVNSRKGSLTAPWVMEQADRATTILLAEAGVTKSDFQSKDYGATLHVEVAGRALSREIDGRIVFSGAEIQGEIALDGPVPYAEQFGLRLAPDSPESMSMFLHAKTPEQAPVWFVLERSGFVGALARMVSRVWKKNEVILLAKVLADKDPSLRRGAAAALSKLGKPGMETLTSGLRQASVAPEAAWGLGCMGEDGVRQLLELSKSGEWWVREAVVRALGSAADPRGVGVAVQAIIDKDQRLRRAGAYTLGRLGGKQAVAALTGALQDECAEVRHEAIMSLGEIGRPAIKELMGALVAKDAFLREWAARALGKSKDPAAVPALVAAGSKDGEREVCWSCIQALEEIADVRAIDALVGMLCHPNEDVQARAELGLVNVGAPALPSLLNALNQEDKHLRLRAIRALGAVGDERALSALREIRESHPRDDEGTEAAVAVRRILARKGGTGPRAP